MKQGIALAMSLAVCSWVSGAVADPQLEQGFAQPPESARPWVNWFWLDGNITSNGITADFEAMKRVGIGGVMLMDVVQGTPAGPVRFGTPEWFAMFQHMSAEAQRLGLQVDMHNADGWCGSGGPWVAPELSMQSVVWSETIVHGPRRLDEPLPRPRTATDHYRDLAVFAFPTPPGEEVRMKDFSPKVTGSPGIETSGIESITLPRPESGRPTFVQLEFPQPYMARSIRFDLPLGNGEVCYGELQISNDGMEFRPVRMLEVEHLKQWYGFPALTSRFYRIVFTSAEPSLKTLNLSNLELSPKFRIEEFESKALFVRRWGEDKSDLPSGFEPALGVSRTSVLNLSSKLGSDDRLNWNAPAGSWTILRMGYRRPAKRRQPIHL